MEAVDHSAASHRWFPTARFQMPFQLPISATNASVASFFCGHGLKRQRSCRAPLTFSSTPMWLVSGGPVGARDVASFMPSRGFWDDWEFVTVEVASGLVVIVDIGMRMLTLRQLQRAGLPGIIRSIRM